MNYAYLHGFASSSQSKKGRALADRLADRGVDLKVPDLNRPSFNELTYTGMLRGIDELDEAADDEPWCMIGSSVGGYIAARWTELNPDRVDRLLLLCPGFNMPGRWADILGEPGLDEWREEGTFLFFDAEDSLQPVHWELYREARDEHPAYPEAQVPTRIIHGRNDEIVLLEGSRHYADTYEDRVELVELDDDHKLYDSLNRIHREALDFFDV